MTPTHHLPEELLLGFAAGTLGEPLSLLVASHASLCRSCRDAISVGEALGGDLLEEGDRAELREGALEQVLARVSEPAPAKRPAAPPRPASLDPRLPAPVFEAIGGVEPRWRFLAPRIRYADLPIRTDSRPVRLVRIAPGVTIPEHGHEGIEFTLVLTGGLLEEDQAFRRGDVLVRDDSHVHELRTEETEICYSLVVQEGSLLPSTFTGRLIQKLSGF